MQPKRAPDSTRDEAAETPPVHGTIHGFFRLLRTYGPPHVHTLAAGGVCLWLTNWISVTIPIHIGKAVDGLRAGADVMGGVWLIMAMGAAVIGVRTLSRVWIFNPGRDMEADLRRDLFAKLMAQQPTFFAGISRGDVVSRAANDVSIVRGMLGYGLMQILNVSLAITLAGWKMLGISWKLTIFAVVPILFGLFFVHMAIKKVQRLYRQSQEQLAEISEHVLASMQGVATIQGFVAEEAFEARFAEKNRALFRTRMKVTVLGSTVFPALVLGAGLATFALIYVGVPLAIQGEMSVGDIAAFATLLGVLIPPMRSLGWMLGVFQRGLAALGRIHELLDVPVDRPDLPDPVRRSGGQGPAFRVRDLHFSYPDAPDNPVLRGIDLDIEAGSMVGIFGRTGSGKTTLVRLLTRLYNPPPGALSVIDGEDEADVRDISLGDWRARLGVAPQRPFLFSDSIRANVALAGEGGDVDRAVELAALGSDLKVLPHGLDTVVGERGIMLSGGQRQRVALARALYQPADVIVLDDVLSSVDHATERDLLDALEELRDREGAPTTFIVSHRLSALRRADRILVLDEGCLVDQGTHGELASRPGLYQDAWRIQGGDNGQ